MRRQGRAARALARGAWIGALAMVALTACETSPPVVTGNAACFNPDLAIDNPRAILSACDSAADRQDITLEQAANARFNLARAHRALGNYELAMRQLDFLRVLSDRRPDARFERVEVRLAQGRLGEAISELDAIIAIDPDNLDALRMRAELHSRRANPIDLERAIGDLETLTRIAPAEMAAEANAELGETALLLAEMELARTPATPESLLRALRAYGWARRADPRDPAGYLGCGQAAGRLAAQFPETPYSADHDCSETGADSWAQLALAAYRAASRLAPASADAQAGIGEALLRLGREEEAVAAFREAARLDPADVGRLARLAGAQRQAADALIAAGRLERADGLLTDAVETYRRAIDLAPGQAHWSLEIGQVWHRLRDLDLSRGLVSRAADRRAKALESLRRAEQAGLRDAQLLIGELYFDEGPSGFAAARQRLSAVANAPGDDLDIAKARANYLLSRIAIEDPGGVQDWSAAIRHADAALELDREPVYRRQACLARIGRGDLSGAARMNCDAISEPGAPDAYIVSGIYHLRQAQFARADDKKRAWETAFLAFSEGLNVMNRDGDLIDAVRRARLTVGRGIAQYCVGFAALGEEMINSTGELLEPTQDFFDRYRVAQCVRY